MKVIQQNDYRRNEINVRIYMSLKSNTTLINAKPKYCISNVDRMWLKTSKIIRAIREVFREEK